MNLNFTKSTLMTGFVLQGHILPIIPITLEFDDDDLYNND